MLGYEMSMIRRAGRRLMLLLIAPVLIACALPEGMIVPEAPLLKHLERKSGTIAYVGGEGNIYTTDQGGTNTVQVTMDAQPSRDGLARQYIYPTWSPDSERLAFVGVTSANSGSFTAGLYTADPDGKDQVETSRGPSFLSYIYWSPDGQQLSYLAHGSNNSTRLEMVPSRGGVEAQTLDTGSPYHWVWAPDSRSMIVHVGGSVDRNESRARVSMLNIDGRVGERSLGVRPTQFQAPAYSPDGTRLLMALKLDTEEDGLILADGSGKIQALLSLFKGAIGFGWSPDGRKVAYIAGERVPGLAVGQLHVLNPDDPTNEKVSEQDLVLAFFWSPDSRKLVYFVLIPSDVQDPGSALTPGQELATGEVIVELRVFDADAGSSREVLTFLPTSDFLNMLFLFDQYQRSMTIWSPDSGNVVISAVVTTSQGPVPAVVVVPASGNLAARVITVGRMAVWSWK